MRIGALIRTWDNPKIVPAVRRVLALGSNSLFVVVDAKRDQGHTPQFLAQLSAQEQALVQAIYLQNYSWSNGLNEGLRALALAFHPVVPADLVLCLSPEAELTAEHFAQMLVAVQCPNVAGAGPAFVGEVHGRSYKIVRNTCAFWRLFTLLQVGGFTTETDLQAGRHGMEDYEISRRLKRLGYKVERLRECCVPLQLRHPEQQREKEQLEQATMEEIDRWYSS